MKAIVCTKYGPPEVLQLQEVEKPPPRNNAVCIKIFATAVTSSDCVIRSSKVPTSLVGPLFQNAQLLEWAIEEGLAYSLPISVYH